MFEIARSQMILLFVLVRNERFEFMFQYEIQRSSRNVNATGLKTLESRFKVSIQKLFTGSFWIASKLDILED